MVPHTSVRGRARRQARRMMQQRPTNQVWHAIQLWERILKGLCTQLPFWKEGVRGEAVEQQARAGGMRRGGRSSARSARTFCRERYEQFINRGHECRGRDHAAARHVSFAQEVPGRESTPVGARLNQLSCRDSAREQRVEGLEDARAHSTQTHTPSQQHRFWRRIYPPGNAPASITSLCGARLWPPKSP